MNGRPPLSVLTSLTRLFSIILISMSLLLALIIIAQREFTPFHAVKGLSMSPQIKSGDAVMIKQIESRDVKVGQVIIFRDPEDPERLVIHRVVAVKDTGYARLFSTKGDNNPERDPWRVSTGAVVGGVAVNFPWLGSFLDFTTNPRGYISCVAIPAAVSLSLVFLLGIGEIAEKPRPPGKPPKRRFRPPPTGRPTV
jgi:signal peptidase